MVQKVLKKELVLYNSINTVSYLIMNNKPADKRCDDRDDVSQEVGDAHQTSAEVRSQVDVHQLEGNHNDNIIVLFISWSLPKREKVQANECIDN